MVAVWVAAAGGAAATLGPALGPGALLSLDLVLTPRIPFPDAVVGLGHDLPRRVPLGAFLSWGSSLVGGPAAGKVLLLACFAFAFAGAARLARPAPLPLQLAAGAVYGFGPFALTRAGAGQWAVLATMAVLPWALPRLLRPAADVGRTFLWLLALSLTGVFGGVVGLVIAGVGLLIAERRARRREWRQVAGVAALAQLPWLLPAMVIGGGGLSVADGGSFAARAEGFLGAPGALLAQHGFWRGASQVGGAVSPGLVVLGAGFLALAIAGHRDLPAGLRKPLAAVAALGAAAAVAPATPGLGALHARATSLLALAPLRESQRLWMLSLVWLAPAAALGAARVARAAPQWAAGAIALPLAGAVAWAVPGLWGIEGRLEPVEFPAAWAQAREVVTAAPGTMLALPWHEYLNLSFASGRRVLNPLPDYFGGDVLSSHDLELGGGPAQESTDPREAAVRGLVPGLSSEDAARLGVRWVVLLHEADWRAYHAALAGDAGLRRVVAGAGLDLYEVRAWEEQRIERPPWKPVLVLTGDALVATAAALTTIRIGRIGRIGRRRGGSSASGQTR